MSSIIDNKFQMFVTVSDNKLNVHFSDDFYLHHEAVETIKLFMDNFVSCQTLTEVLVKDVIQWFQNYLGLCFDIGLATTIFRPDFVKIEGERK